MHRLCRPPGGRVRFLGIPPLLGAFAPDPDIIANSRGPTIQQPPCTITKVTALPDTLTSKLEIPALLLALRLAVRGANKPSHRTRQRLPSTSRPRHRRTREALHTPTPLSRSPQQRFTPRQLP